MPQAARKGDLAQHDDSTLSAAQGSPNVFINGQPAVRKGDAYQSPRHAAARGSATVNVNGKPAIRVGDPVSDHATACTGSPNVIIGNSSYGAAQKGKRPVYEILLSQVPGSAELCYVYGNYPYKLFLNGKLAQEGRTEKDGIIKFEYEPPLKGPLRVEMGNGDSFQIELRALAPANTRQGIIQRMRALGYFHHKGDESDTDMALREGNSITLNHPVNGVLDDLAAFIKAKMP